MFAKHLLKQIKTIPLWSSIRRDSFGYGRIPASSAPVEGEFNIIKNQILLNVSRLDIAVEKIVTYFIGKLKLVNCSIGKELKINETNINGKGRSKEKILPTTTY